MQIDAQKAGSRLKGKLPLRHSKYEEMPAIPEQAMEFLSRTWNPSSSDILEILSPRLNVGQMRTILREYFLDTFSFTGRRRRQRRDDLRLHSAQAQAAVSVAQLAAAIAGVVSAFEPRTSLGDNGKLGGELASAAALVATVCAEAAESAGAHRPRVTSAVNTGLESRSPAELLTLTAAAATCLRGAAALKLRAADVRGIGTAASGHG
ncbi:hypothetical protein QYE76_029431 [Lolium multiflorum]|uniref:VAN3-binding protein-like auxin canalisation domain-containing protein n=1 Tax=Lolium multiflorum TaxID=4521 RepID=A0AAD8QRE4_LOLMU|nr:hypothetical protein QYE76_029431 [Lolium multiflorum]